MSKVRAAPGSLRAPLDAALEHEIAHLELRATQVWQIIAVLCMVLVVILTGRSHGALAVWGTGAAAVFLAWFSVVAHLLKTGRGSPALRVATIVVESLVAWVVLVVLAFTQGPAYALGSWAPPLLFAGMVVVSTARLRPIEPLIFGVSGAVVFLLLYFGWFRGALPHDLLTDALYSTRVQLSRALSLSTGGLAGRPAPIFPRERGPLHLSLLLNC